MTELMAKRSVWVSGDLQIMQQLQKFDHKQVYEKMVPSDIKTEQR